MTKTFSYEVHERTADEPRPGWLSLLIDGVDADFTVDPNQWLSLALEDAAVEGLTGPAAAAHAEEYGRRRAEQAIMRRADRLRAARPLGAGVSRGEDIDAEPERLSESQTVERYLNRGRLKGLDHSQRRARMAKRAQKFDNDADWAARRQKLIEECAAEIQSIERALAEDPGNPKLDRNLRIARSRLRGLSPKVVAVIHGFQYAYTQYWLAAINLSTDDIRIWPYMTNTTLDTVRDAVDTYGDVTLDEFDGANYTSGGLALDSQTVAVDDGNDRAEFDCADEVVTALGAGTRSMQGVSPGKFVTNTAASIPLHAIDFATNKNPDGSDFTFAINAEGLLQMADG